ncbi:MAG: ATP-binding protein [Candidatus Sericytochromatia bacterium]
MVIKKLLLKLYRNDLEKDKEVVLITSLVSLIGFSVALPYSIIFFLLNNLFIAYSLFFFSIYIFFVFLLSRSKYFEISKIMFAFSNAFFIYFFCDLFGRDSLVQCFFSILVCYYFIFFNKEKYLRYIYIITCIFLFILLEITDYSLLPELKLSEGIIKFLHISVFIVNSIILYLFLFFFKKSFIKATNKAEKASKARQNFLAHMSHEIRTPMNAVIGFTNLLYDEIKETEHRENIKALKNSSENLMTIINDILDLSKIDAGKISLEKYDFNLKELVFDIKRIFIFNAKEKGLDLEINFDNNIYNNIIGDKVRLTQIISNLISNAIKFTEKGKVELIVEKLNETDKDINIKFIIKDTGIGISEDNKLKIFDIFTQISSDVSRKSKGTGLGLTIVKNLLELFNSKIELKSNLNQGSEFSFITNFEKSNIIINTEKIEETNTQNFSYIKVLLVEDNDINILVAKKILKKFFINPEIANNGLQAVDKSKQKTYDLVLMDINMPEMDGIEATKLIRQEKDSKNNNTVIVALTADVMIEQENFLKDNKMDFFISKPFNNSDLIKIFNHIKQLNLR